jgi:hypothetical protein
MATPGANLDYGNNEKVWNRILKKFGMSRNVTLVGQGQEGQDPTTLANRTVGICLKNGAPANNTAADAPTGVGDFCFDATNKQVYRCSAYTNGTTFTWVLIV